MPVLQPAFIFSDSRTYRLRRHIAFWVACVLFFTFIYGSRPYLDTPNLYIYIFTSYRISLFEAIAYLPLHIFFSYSLMYVLIPQYLFKSKYAKLLGLLLLNAFLVGAFSYLITRFMITPFRDFAGVPKPHSNFYYSLMGGLRGGLTVGGFAGAIKLAKHWYFKNQLNQQLEAEKLKAELQLLKAQVHPHFLFNTLNNLYALTLTQSHQAPEIVLKLAGLLRYILYECNVPKVPLEKEIKLITDYIELEKLRYGDRLDLAVNIKGEPAGLVVAPLLVLPFLENSFKHGASEHLDQAWISLDLAIQGNKLKLKLLNAIPENETTVGSSSGSPAGGIGLNNVKKRLQLIYPDAHELKIRQETDSFLVSLQIDLESGQVAPVTEALTYQTAPQAAKLTSTLL